MLTLGLGPPSPSPPRSRTLYKILDSCKQLTLAQGAGEEDPSGMVTIITGLPLDNPSTLSGPMQVGHGMVRGRVEWGRGTGVDSLRPDSCPFPLLLPLLQPLNDLCRNLGGQALLNLSFPQFHRQPYRPLHVPVWTSRMFWTSTSSGRRLAETEPQALQRG